MSSKYFNPSALQGLDRIGDLFLPQNGEFPSFSQSRAAEHVDDLLAYAPPSDVGLLNLVLVAVRYLPAPLLNWLLRRLENAHQDHGPLGSLLRQLNFGLRGLLFTLYYGGKASAGPAGKTPLEVIGYELNRVEV